MSIKSFYNKQQETLNKFRVGIGVSMQMKMLNILKTSTESAIIFIGSK